MNLRLSVPELRRQPTLNLQMIQLQLNHVDTLREIPAHISGADVQSGYFTTLELRLDHHCSPSDIPGGPCASCSLEPLVRRRTLAQNSSRGLDERPSMRLCWTHFRWRSSSVRKLILRKISFSDLLNCLAARKATKLRVAAAKKYGSSQPGDLPHLRIQFCETSQPAQIYWCACADSIYASTLLLSTRDVPVSINTGNGENASWL